MPSRRAQRVVNDTVEATRAALDAVDPDDYPGVSAKALDTVRHRLPPAVANVDSRPAVVNKAATATSARPRGTGRQTRVQRGVPSGGQYAPRHDSTPKPTLN